MSTGFRRGVAVVAGLLLAGCLFAGQASVQNVATAGMLSSPGLTSPDHGRPGSLPPKALDIMYNNDVGVSNIISPNGIIAFGDRVFPRGRAQNAGSRTQTNIPVICVIYDSAAGARVYGPETVYVASLDSGCACNVDFPYWAPSTQEKVYFDTMATALPGDEDTSNDWKAGRFAVAVWGEGHLTYNDGTFENAVSWMFAGSELTERFVAPERPLTVSKAALWLTSFSKDDYDAEVRVYGNDGSPHGYPGTQLGVWVGKLQTDTWGLFRRNEVCFDPPIVVDYDTFFVSYYQTSITPGYPYIAWDTISATIDIGNDWGWCNKDSFRTWGLFPYDASSDLGIDAYYDAPLLDGSVKGITVPLGAVDSNTTFTPQVVVKNAGLCDRDSIVAEFFITSSSDAGDTSYAGTASSGPIQAGQTKAVTFAQSVTLEPGNYTMTSITLLPYDARPHNDTLVRSLAVGRLGVENEKAGSARVSFTIAPNPLARTATVRYNLPKAGLVTFDVYDATGREVLSQTIAAKRVGTVALDLRELQAGVYVVRVKGDAFSSTQKLVVER